MIPEIEAVRGEMADSAGPAGTRLSRIRPHPALGPRTEAGAALLGLLLVLLVGSSYALMQDARSLAQRAKLEESRKTTAALAEAKAGLIGYAVSRGLDPNCAASGNNCARPGDLPCPDIDNDGIYPATGPGSSCGNASGSTGQTNRLARLPWKTLALPDVRDGAGEGLWYAVSSTFKANTRATCTNPGSFGCLNSDARGRITVKVAGTDTDSDGDPDAINVVHDGRNPDWRNPAEQVNPGSQWTPSGAIAVVIAPGKPIEREDGLVQTRGGACAANSVSCRRNYLDTSLGEDNADFFDRPNLANRFNGFVSGEILGNCGGGDCDVIVNDRVLPITYEDLIPVLERRVVGEVRACLRGYDPPLSPSSGPRYPWAAEPNPADPLDYDDDETAQARFGRLPDVPFEVDPALPTQMPNQWSTACPLLRTGTIPYSTAQWWLNWKELVFYGVAKAYQPAATPPATAPDPCANEGACLAVNPVLPPPPDPLPCLGNTQVLVMVSGKRLQAVPDVPEPQTAPSGITIDQRRQSGAQKADIRNYLESYNATIEGDPAVDPNGPCSALPAPSYVYFKSGKPTSLFNDVIGFLP